MTFKNIHKKKITIPISISLLLIIISSFIIVCMMFLLQVNGVYDLLFILKKTNYLPLLLNYIPVLLLMLLLFFISNSAIISINISSLLLLTASFVNRYKMQLRQDPFLPWDFALVNEAITIVKENTLYILYIYFIFVFLVFIFTIIFSHFIKSKEINIYVKFAAIISIISVAFVLNNNYYKNDKIFNNLFVMGNVYNQKDSFESKGFLYSFIYASNSNHLKKVEGYNKNDIEKFIATFEKPDYSIYENNQKSHVFMIMSEAFSEISNNPDLDFTNYTDPLENFNEIKKESIYGNIVVPNFGGGTGDTEFDVLTGLNTRYLRGVPFSYRIVNKNLNALPKILNNIGYNNVAIHPGHKWFYNRANVYEKFYFSKFIDIKSFPLDLYKGMYVDETSTYNTIISEFENNLPTGKPFFDFCVTIQNHGPYKDKYLVQTNFETDLDISPDEINAMSNYFDGVKDGDRELKRLVDYAKASSEPIVIVYFGDHNPAFKKETYEKIVDKTGDPNSLDVLTARYTTPFIIWQNSASKKINDFDEIINQINLPENNIISDNYLGTLLLKLLGYENADPFFSYSLKLLEKYPVLMENEYFDANKVPYKVDDDMIFKYKEWEYYKLFDEKIK